jgi:hypothetical protein
MRTRKDLIEAAKASAGHTVSDYSGHTLVLVGKRGASVIFWNDGAMTRGDVRLDVACKIRTVKEAANLLDLTEEVR